MPRTHRLKRKSKTNRGVNTPAPKASASASTTSPAPTSFGTTLAQSVTSGIGWGIGTSTIKAMMGMSGEATKTSPERHVAPTQTTISNDACDTLWLAYQRCLQESDERACDAVKQGFDRVCSNDRVPPVLSFPPL